MPVARWIRRVAALAARGMDTILVPFPILVLAGTRLNAQEPLTDGDAAAIAKERMPDKMRTEGKP